MFGFITNLVGGAVAPLIDAVAETSVRLLRKVALFLVAALCLAVVTVALTIAFALWIAALAGPIVAALAVAGLYLLVAVIAIVLALQGAPKQAAPAVDIGQAAPSGSSSRNPELRAQIDQFIAPILDLLQRFGLRREQLAVFTGATMAKQLGPLPLVGCAIVVGFLVGRLWKSWRHILEAGLALAPFAADVFAARADTAPPDRAS